MSQAFEFLAGGDVGVLMRAHEWSRSPLGPPTGWPPSLRTVVALLLQSRLTLEALAEALGVEVREDVR